MSRASRRAASKAARSQTPPTPRDRQSDGRRTDLSQMVPSAVPMDGTDWFGPGRPLPPVAPDYVRGRRWDFGYSENTNQVPRWNHVFSFQEIRAFASYPLVRVAIETRKDQVSTLKWTIGLADSEDELSEEQQARAKKIRKMLTRPDGRLFWIDWIRMVMDEMLTIDASSIFVRRNRGGDPLSLHIIDGSTIKPVIDENGYTPAPPQAAYTQFLHGVTAVDYSTDQLIYRPRNMRTWTVYGHSPVEQIMVMIGLAIRRLSWQTAFFTNGNVPDSLIGVPQTWTPDQIRDFQDWFDGVLMGNTERRRGATFVPGEVAKSYTPTKTDEMFGAGEEWLSRVVCWAFSISHQALVKEVNKATAGTAKAMAEEEGLGPVLVWILSLMKQIFVDVLGEEELEFKWEERDETDPQAKSEMLLAQVKEGVISREEMREDIGRDPFGTPEAGELMVTLATGLVPVSQELEIKQKKAMQDAFPAPEPALGPDGKPVQSSGSGGPEGESGGARAGGTQPAAPPASAKKSAPVPPADAAAWYALVSPVRPTVESARVRLQTVLQRGLARVGARVVAAVETTLDSLQRPTTKADTPEEHEDAHIMRSAMDAIGSMDFLIDPTAELLGEIADGTTRVVLAHIGSTTASGMVDQVSARAVAAARDRAAELVGRRVLDDGSVVDNPDARWAISESTRTEIHDLIERVLADNTGSDTIIQELQDAHAFSPARAEMVSRTEVAMANQSAAMESYRAAEDAGVTVQKEWYLGENPCDECLENAAAGPIDLADDFPSGDSEAPAHPNCVCAVVPVVTAAEEETE